MQAKGMGSGKGRLGGLGSVVDGFGTKLQLFSFFVFVTR